MNATIYYAPDAVGSLSEFFTDGDYMYTRVHGLGDLGSLHGWLRRIGRKIRRGVKKIGKKIKKVAKKTWKAVKKVGGKVLTVIRKALPIVSTVLSFVPGVGWVASAALMAAEMGLNAMHKAQLRRKRRKQMKALNARKTTPVTPVTKVNPLKKVGKTSSPKVDKEPVQSTPVKKAPVFTAMDFVKINQALNKNRVTPDQLIQLAQAQRNKSLQPILNF